jgi:flavin reductase (DIM6/NTAB) family NADH-FMN oxidoreductase RutF
MKNKKENTLSKVDLSIAYRLFYPQVPLVVCAKFENKIAAMPANSCMPISMNPPKVAVSIFRNTRTNSIVSGSRRFSINWVSYDNEKLRKAIIQLGSNFSSKKQSLDKLYATDIEYSLWEDIPVIKRCTAFELCAVERRLRQEDHDLFVASVLEARASFDFEKYWRFRSYKPTLYLGSNRKKQDQLRSF